jgi:hypothetical protein
MDLCRWVSDFRGEAEKALTASKRGLRPPSKAGEGPRFGHQALSAIPSSGSWREILCSVSCVPAPVQKGSECLTAFLSAFRTKENGCYGQRTEQARVCRSASIGRQAIYRESDEARPCSNRRPAAPFKKGGT